MDYQEMTIAQLRSLAKERAISIPRGAKKTQIIALLEEQAHEVIEAEVIDNPTIIKIADGASVDINDIQETIKKADNAIRIANDKVTEYSKYALGSLPQKTLKFCRADLNTSKKAIEKHKKHIKEALMHPVSIIYAEIDKSVESLDALEERMGEQVRKNDEVERLERETHLREHYASVAGEIANIVPYERIADEKWLNKEGWKEAEDGTLSNPKHEEAIEHIVLGIGGKLKTLETMKPQLFDADATIKQFLETLDLDAAVASDSERKDAYEELKASAKARNAVAHYTHEPVYEPVYESVVEPIEPVEPACVYEPISQPIENAAQPTRGEALFDDVPKPRVMLVEAATVEQCREIGKACGKIGVTGTFKAGTLEEVFFREFPQVHAVWNQRFKGGA